MGAGTRGVSQVRNGGGSEWSGCSSSSRMTGQERVHVWKYGDCNWRGRTASNESRGGHESLLGWDPQWQVSPRGSPPNRVRSTLSIGELQNGIDLAGIGLKSRNWCWSSVGKLGWSVWCGGWQESAVIPVVAWAVWNPKEPRMPPFIHLDQHL
jgi:hypothetical protein